MNQNLFAESPVVEEAPSIMSTEEEVKTEAPPAPEIIPAKSEDKLEIEKEEAEKKVEEIMEEVEKEKTEEDKSEDDKKEDNKDEKDGDETEKTDEVKESTTEEPAGAFKTTSSKTSPDDVSIVVSSVCATKPTPDIVPDNVKEPSSAVLIDGSSEPSTPSPS